MFSVHETSEATHKPIYEALRGLAAAGAVSVRHTNAFVQSPKVRVPVPPRPTDAELEILRVLWDRGPSTVRDVHDALGEARGVGYTTVLKLMQIMAEKGLVARDESSRSHVYRAHEKRESTQRRLVRDLVSRAFGGSTESLVLQALSSKKATPAEIAEIRRLLDDMERGNR